MSKTIINILVLGSSHVTRLQAFSPSNLTLADTHCQFLSRGGLKFNDIPGLLNDLKGDFKVIFLQMGGNDLKPVKDSSLEICRDYLEAIKVVHQKFPESTLVVGSLFYRDLSTHLNSLVKVDTYNKEVDKLNQLLEALVPEEADATWWTHPRLYKRMNVLMDGTHFGEKGLSLLYRSVRGAFIKTLKEQM